MSRMSTEPVRHALNGPTMGTRWSAVIHAEPGLDPESVRQALAAAVAEVDAQMSTWTPDSDLMRLNRAPAGAWCEVPTRLMEVLSAGLDIGRASSGAFDIGMGDVVSAWGFSAETADPARIRALLGVSRRAAHELLELDPSNRRVRKHGPIALDLCGIAKGYGVDRLAAVAESFGIGSALVAIDGEVRAIGTRPDGQPWAVAVERPDPSARAVYSVLALEDAAVATSGDYRHWVDLGGQRLSHTMDPLRGAPLADSPASVTVVAPSCMLADGWATALMVLGRAAGAERARAIGLSALFLDRAEGGLAATGMGPIFEPDEAAAGARAVRPGHDGKAHSPLTATTASV